MGERKGFPLRLDPEVYDALQRWADHVEQLMTGKPAKVLPLHGRWR